MNLHVGTSGYSYKEWKGIFYPEDLPAKEMLSYYSRQLPAVEINNTFYRLATGEHDRKLEEPGARALSLFDQGHSTHHSHQAFEECRRRKRNTF
jgi:hypothetical protein